MPVPDPGRVPLRLRRRRGAHPAAQDAHPRQGLRAPADPRRWPALPRHGAAGLARHQLGLLDAIAIDQDAAFAAGVEFARAEGIIPAPESTHAVAGAIAHARQATTDETIVIGLSGNGVLDLPSYARYV